MATKISKHPETTSGTTKRAARPRSNAIGHRPPDNLIPNGDWQLGETGGLPEGWELKAHPHVRPLFKLARKAGRKLLLAGGDGNPDCSGYVTTSFSIERGRTYRLSVRFRMSRDVNPMQHLLFAFHTPDIVNDGTFNHGVFHFHRDPADPGLIVGDERFFLPGSGCVTGDVRLTFRYSARGRVWLEQASLTEDDPIAPRWVRVACVEGRGTLEDWAWFLDEAARDGADIALVPETMNGLKSESIDGPAARLLAQKARQHKMYVCGGFLLWDEQAGRQYNTALLFDRKGRLSGRYDKQHPFSPEVINEGTTSGTDLPVFETDFGKLGIMICADNWFPDVAELLALKGAEIVLFPNAGYYRSLMPARSADNRVRIVCSSLNVNRGIWDTTGANIEDPDADSSRYAGDAVTFKTIRTAENGSLRMLCASLDLAQSPLPHNWGGPMLSAPGSYRNRRDQKRLLYDEIKREVLRWWD